MKFRLQEERAEIAHSRCVYPFALLPPCSGQLRAEIYEPTLGTIAARRGFSLSTSDIVNFSRGLQPKAGCQENLELLIEGRVGDCGHDNRRRPL